MQLAKENGIQEITYYGFTKDNCQRPPEQFQAFQRACVEAVDLLSQEGADLFGYGGQPFPVFPPGSFSLTPGAPRSTAAASG